MKLLLLFLAFVLPIICFSAENEVVKTEGEITEITVHSGKRKRETAIVKFKLENGEEQFGNVELFRIPFLGSFKSVGDKITINYDKANPVLVETVYGKLLTDYGMYILILLGIVFSIKPFLKMRKNAAS
jgi:hypothetical protein